MAFAAGIPCHNSDLCMQNVVFKQFLDYYSFIETSMRLFPECDASLANCALCGRDNGVCEKCDSNYGLIEAACEGMCSYTQFHMITTVLIIVRVLLVFYCGTKHSTIHPDIQ